MELIRLANEVIAKFKDENEIIKIGLGCDSLTKTDVELKTLANQKYADILYRRDNPWPPTYRELRQKEYPSIQEQLDMMYWDSVNGTNKWRDLITSIKAKFPKV